MVKDVSRNNIEYRVKRISISVDSLIKIIESVDFEKVTARNQNTEFENINDMRSHKDLLVGEPVIYCDSMRIFFNRTSSTVSVGAGIRNIDPSIVKSVYLQLMSHKTWTDRLADNATVIISTLGMTTVTALVLKNSIKGESPSLLYYFNIIDGVTSFLFIPLILIFPLGLYIDFIRSPVVNRKSEGFFKRNFDNIFIATVTAVIGAVVGSAATYYITKLAG